MLPGGRLAWAMPGIGVGVGWLIKPLARKRFSVCFRRAIGGQPYDGPPISPAPPIQHRIRLPLTYAPSQLPADNIFGIRPPQVGDRAYSYNNTPPFAMAFIRGTCDYNQASDIRNATYAAGRQIGVAIDLLKNYPDAVIPTFENLVMGSNRLGDRGNHPRILEMLESVHAELEQGRIPYYVRTTKNGNEREAYVNFLIGTNIRTSRCIYLNPIFFTCPGGEGQRTTMVIYELGRYQTLRKLLLRLIRWNLPRVPIVLTHILKQLFKRVLLLSGRNLCYVLTLGVILFVVRKTKRGTC